MESPKQVTAAVVVTGDAENPTIPNRAWQVKISILIHVKPPTQHLCYT